MYPQVGDPAPSFSASDAAGNVISPRPFQEEGRRAVLLSEGQHVRLHNRGLRLPRCQRETEEGGVEVIGVSPDSAASHQKFADKFDLPFRWPWTRKSRSVSPTASGRRNRCTAANTWRWPARRSSSTARAHRPRLREGQARGHEEEVLGLDQKESRGEMTFVADVKASNCTWGSEAGCRRLS